MPPPRSGAPPVSTPPTLLTKCQPSKQGRRLVGRARGETAGQSRLTFLLGCGLVDLERESVDLLDDLNGLEVGLIVVLGQVAGEGVGSLGGDQEYGPLQGGQAREDQVEEDERIGIEAVLRRWRPSSPPERRGRSRRTPMSPSRCEGDRRPAHPVSARPDLSSPDAAAPSAGLAFRARYVCQRISSSNSGWSVLCRSLQASYQPSAVRRIALNEWSRFSAWS